MCNWLKASGLKKKDFLTPREFAIQIKKILNVSDKCISFLTNIFEKACYSDHEITEKERDKSIDCLNEIISTLIIESSDNEEEQKGK
jgi:hypothetical protein